MNNLMLTIIAIVAGYVCVELAWKQIFNYFGFQIMKLDIPKFRYLFQDLDGEVVASIYDTYPHDDLNWWQRTDMHIDVCEGKYNEDWRNTRIDLETDDYEFEDGILRRIEK